MRINWLLASSSILTLGAISAPAVAQDFESSESAEGAESFEDGMVVIGRRAYRGDFEPLEVPQIDQVLAEDLGD